MWEASLGGSGAEVRGGLGHRGQAYQEVAVGLLGIDVEVHGLVREVLRAGRSSMVSIAFLGTTILLPKRTVGSRSVRAIL
jgi:hypothetical protein